MALVLGLVVVTALAGSCKSIKNTIQGPYKSTLRGRPTELVQVCFLTGPASVLDPVVAEVREGKVGFLSEARQQAYWDFAQLVNKDERWQFYQPRKVHLHGFDADKDGPKTELPLRIGRALSGEAEASLVVAAQFSTGKWSVHQLHLADFGQLGGSTFEVTARELRFLPKDK